MSVIVDIGPSLCRALDHAFFRLEIAGGSLPPAPEQHNPGPAVSFRRRVGLGFGGGNFWQLSARRPGVVLWERFGHLQTGQKIGRGKRTGARHAGQWQPRPSSSHELSDTRPEENARQAGPPPRRLPRTEDKRGGVLRSNYKRERGRVGLLAIPTPRPPRLRNFDQATCFHYGGGKGPGEATGGPRDTLLSGNSRMRIRSGRVGQLCQGSFGGGEVYAKVVMFACVIRATARIGQGETAPPLQGA